jgi:hypothetical protein
MLPRYTTMLLYSVVLAVILPDSGSRLGKRRTWASDSHKKQKQGNTAVRYATVLQILLATDAPVAPLDNCNGLHSCLSRCCTPLLLTVALHAPHLCLRHEAKQDIV